MPKLILFDEENKSIELVANNYKYQIKNVNDWKFLINCKKINLQIFYTNSGFVNIPIPKKFLNYQSYEILNDLDFENTELTPWIEFFGSLEGNNKTISNLRIYNTLYNGLFGMCNKSKISNLNFSNIEITGGKYNGVLIGYAHEVKLENIKINDNIKVDGINNGIISGFFRGDIHNISININDLDSPLFGKFYGCLRNSIIQIFNNNKQYYICNIFNGFISNCFFISNNNNNLFENFLNGKINNSKFYRITNFNDLPKSIESFNNKETNNNLNEIDLNDLNNNIWIIN
jgi:hypothetical protein